MISLFEQLERHKLIQRIAAAGITEEDEVLLPPSPTTPPIEITLNPGQERAVSEIVAWRLDPAAPRVFKLSGAAGTGKSTVMGIVRKRLQGTRTAWCAMTGKAASRLAEASGVAAKTFHSVLYDMPLEVDNEAEQKIDLDFSKIRGGGRSCLLVIDEASMISPKVRADIDRSAYDKILLVGDSYQIPPVLSKREERESGADYSVFTGVPGPHLDEVMRNSGAVLAAATVVRERQEIPKESASDLTSTYVYEEAKDRSDALYASVHAWLEDRDDHVLITWRNETRMMANHVIRQQLGLESVLPQRGEPLIVRRNIYNRDMYETPLMNGDVVLVEEWLNDGPTLCGVETRFLQAQVVGANSQVILVATSTFDGVLPYVGLDAWKSAIHKEGCDEPIPMTYGYCLTGHLAQGSEYRRVTTFLPGDFSNPYFKKQTQLPDGSSMRFSMRFLYTALSRARQHSTLIVSR